MVKVWAEDEVLWVTLPKALDAGEDEMAELPNNPLPARTGQT
jgi:hypothetical protein